jgi:hypothetical protein
VVNEKHPDVESVDLAGRVFVVLLCNMVVGSMITETWSEVLGSESGPKNKAPFGHPQWVPKLRLITWAVF